MTKYTPDEEGKCFVDGLGWVVQCSHALKYAVKLFKAVEEARKEYEKGNTPTMARRTGEEE